MAEDTGNAVQEHLKEATCFEWPQGNALGDCLVELYDKCLWTDVKFRCEDHEDGEFIQAHTIVLNARSPVFKAMFFGPFSDGKGEIVLNTTKSETLQLFLRYLYCDKITLTEEKALTVLEMAHFYQVPSLVQNCAEYLTTVISVGNACGLLTYAMQYNLTNLKNCCCSFIDNSAEEVLNSDGFMNLSAECLLYILKGDTLNADEKLILEASEKWSRRKMNERGLEETGANIRKFLGEAFYYLRLPTMTSKSFMECICRKGYFSIEEYAEIAAFIGKAPGISVSTNSCVARCPEKETLIPNNRNGDVVTKDRISNTFDISVTKDVAISSFIFSEITPVVNCTINYSTIDIDLPENLEVVLSGCFVLTDLDFKYNFSLHQSQSRNKRVTFEPPLELKTRKRPYRLKLNVDFGCSGKVRIKTRESNREEITNPTGHVQINTVSGTFTGIEKIELVNFSQRDLYVQTAPKTYETSLSTE